MFQTLISARIPAVSRTFFRKISTDALVRSELDGKTGFATVTLNRAPVNALSLEMMTEVGRTIDELEKQNINGMIITSFSNNVFCAGLDLMEMIDPNPDRLRAVWVSLQDMWARIYGCSFPSVAIVNGHAPAGGCLLAISCEYRIMYPNFRIGLNETALGIVVPPWLQVTMRNTIGARNTEMGCTKGTLYSTEQALQIGLVDELAFNLEEATEKGTRYLKTFQNMSRYARSATKLLLRNKDIADMKQGREDDVQRFLKNVLNPEFQQELKSYMRNLKHQKSEK